MARRRKRSNQAVFWVILGFFVFFGGSLVFAVGMFALKHVRANAPASAILGPQLAYNTRIREKTLSADEAPLGTPLRSHKNHPWVKLLSAQQELSNGNRQPLNFWLPGKIVVIDYQSSADFKTHVAMKHAKVYVILKNERGEESEFGSYMDYDKFEGSGTWVVSGSNNWAFRRGGDFTPNMEVFVVLEDFSNLEKPVRFKISNSLCIGDKAGITLARAWKDDEVAAIETMATSPEPVRFIYGEEARRAQEEAKKKKEEQKNNPPATTQPAQPVASAETKTGTPPATSPVPATQPPAPARPAEFPAKPPVDSAQAVASAARSATYGAPGGWKYEFAQPQPVLGFAYRFGTWDRHPSFAGIRPLFKEEQIAGFNERILAKPGYAVGGVTIETSPFVSGMQVVFMKLKGDRLDPDDSYKSDWIRAEKVKGDAQKPILSVGKLVIGVYGNNGAVVNTMGLIFQ